MFNSTQMISSCTVNKNNETAATFYIKFIQSCLCVFFNSVFLLTDGDCYTTQTAQSVCIHYTVPSFHHIFPSFLLTHFCSFRPINLQPHPGSSTSAITIRPLSIVSSRRWLAERKKNSIQEKSQFKFKFELNNLKRLIVEYHT